MSNRRSMKVSDWLVSRFWWSRTVNGLKMPRAPRPPSANRHAQEISAEQIRLLYCQLSSALMATVVVGGLVGYVLWDQVSRPWLLMWLVALGATTVARVWLLRSYLRTNPPASEAPRWAHRFIIGTAGAGVIWGLAGLFSFHGSSFFHEVFIAFVLAGLSAGAMSTLSSYRGAYLAFLGPAIAPYAIRLTLQKGEMYLAMGLMLFMFISMMFIISVRHYRSVAASLRLRYDNFDLLADLRAAAQRLEGKVQERTKELAQANIVLESEKELFRVTLASIGDAVITTDATACVTFLNAVAEHLIGWTEMQAKGQPLSEVFRLVDEETHEPVEDPVARCLHGNGRAPEEHGLLICRDRREISVDTSVAPIRDNDNKTIGTVLVFRDVSAQRKLAQELSHQATHDTLTGLVNRAEFERRLTHLLALASPHSPHALLYLDLDQFKVVNDTCGHIAGDDLLRQISALLRTKLRTRDTLARLGGDEFGVLLDHCAAAEAKRVANTLREVLEGFRFGWQDKSFTIGVSIGLVPIVEPGETLSSVFSAADAACYAAKDMGRNRVHIYQADDRMLARRDGEMRWIPRIQQALADDRFRLYYQPIFPFSPSTIHERHGEILLRMLDEQGRIVLPGAFIPAAERYGLMLAIDRWVVSRSLEALSAVGGDAGVFTINVSGQSLGATEFLDFVTERIRDTHVAPDKLCFEVTETAAASELGHVLRFIDALKGVGCRFALDDFGTGLSSFSYLKTLPVDYLKIDGAFIRELASDDIDRAMVEAVNRIGHKMGLLTIAEWVESVAISQKLQEIGVDYGQGYALGKPEPLNLQQALASTRFLPRRLKTR
jgi:diguanylate cyclase (GGDEF)-like protein/PAS domain S-box-containing protein